jgi:hypothetical protein
MGAIGVGLGALIFGKKGAFGSVPDVPGLDAINPSQLQKDTAAGNQGVLPQATALSQAINANNATQFRSLLNMTVPGAWDQAVKNTNSQLRGEVSQDVASQVDNYTNALALQLGVGGNSPFRVGLTGGKFLQTSQQIQQQGFQNFGQLASMTPKQYDFTNSFLNPATRYQMQNQQNENQFARDFTANQLGAMASPFARAMTQGLIQDESTITGLVGTAAGAAGGGGL